MPTNCLAGVRGSQTHLSRLSRGITDLKWETRLPDSESLISPHLMPSSLKEFVTIFRAQSSTESGRSLFAYLLLMRQPLVGQATRDGKYPR